MAIGTNMELEEAIRGSHLVKEVRRDSLRSLQGQVTLEQRDNVGI